MDLPRQATLLLAAGTQAAALVTGPAVIEATLRAPPPVVPGRVAAGGPDAGAAVRLRLGRRLAAAPEPWADILRTAAPRTAPDLFLRREIDIDRAEARCAGVAARAP